MPPSDSDARRRMGRCGNRRVARSPRGRYPSYRADAVTKASVRFGAPDPQKSNESKGTECERRVFAFARARLANNRSLVGVCS